MTSGNYYFIFNFSDIQRRTRKMLKVHISIALLLNATIITMAK